MRKGKSFKEDWVGGNVPIVDVAMKIDVVGAFKGNIGKLFGDVTGEFACEAEQSKKRSDKSRDKASTANFNSVSKNSPAKVFKLSAEQRVSEHLGIMVIMHSFLTSSFFVCLEIHSYCS